MTEYKCGSAKSCKYGYMCRPSYDIGGCCHFKQKKPQTNEEWLRTATTEQLIEFLEKITDPHVGYLVGYWEKWLKQPHKEE